jgi:hypothetical protein
MKPTLLFKILCLILGLLICVDAGAVTPIPLQCLWSAYKNFRITEDQREIVFKSGQILPYKTREPADAPIDPKNLQSLEQMFLAPYPIGFHQNAQGKWTYPIPTALDELRASRFHKFFFELYGWNESEVRDDLIAVPWIDGTHVAFNRKYGAAASLRIAVEQLRALIQVHPEYRKFLRRPIGGTFNWRHVAGQDSISLHSFGIAIDINLDEADYWEWDTVGHEPPRYRNRIPPQIADIFERNGFVWGGKWYHYDTMHFEYRPELTMDSSRCEREFKSYPNASDLQSEGAPANFTYR